jgi:hypothetical protein
LLRRAVSLVQHPTLWSWRRWLSPWLSPWLCRDFDGKLWHNAGTRIGYLQQEPQLDASKDVNGNVMDGLREKTQLLDRMDAISAEMGAPDADIDAVSRCAAPCRLASSVLLSL